jgi:23S rRNA (cytidine1920-2'-O)/16S rRNA (cytidine1409-2'-O)-methyltransferase
VKRLDCFMAETGAAESRELARKLIIAGAVLVNGRKAIKPSEQVADTVRLEVIKEPPYVSRGGFKLEKALKEFGINPADKVAVDIGASTGGFTDCMLQNGAVQVYAVDVGYGQLHQKLRGDPRVVVMERTNARYLAKEMFAEPPRFATVDVAFISLRLILPPLLNCLEENADIVALVKPQFEAGAKHVKKGVVRDAQVHAQVLNDILDWLRAQPASVKGLSWSPITGPKGNIEFLLHLKKSAEEWIAPDVDALVKTAHEEVKRNPVLGD